MIYLLIHSGILSLGGYLFRYFREFDIPANLKSIFRILEEGEATKTSEESISDDKDIKTTRHYLRSNLSIIISCKSSLWINYEAIVNPMLKEKISSMSESELGTLFDKYGTIDKLNSIKQKMKEEVSDVSNGIQSFADL
ncbi:MAG: hypothetical protein GKB99_02735 [Methanocellales archaeon]|nr:hypothetical protein [Methanocellales archaeon]